MNRVDFTLSAADLTELVTVLRNGLLQRPAPQEDEFLDLQEALESCEDYFLHLRDLAENTGQLTAQDLLMATEGMVEGYHALWQQSFPYGLEAGQQLFSAVLERPMRDLLNGLEALKNDCTPDGPLLILDAEAELECFNHWVDNLPDYQRQGLRPEPTGGCGLGSLAASFLLGWWFGRD